MTYPRSHLVDPAERGIYHVNSRCVRRAWLCGLDPDTGRDFSHRRAWIERRILQLADLFAVAIYGYAVMSNHYHIVVELNPRVTEAWSDEEVAERWLTLCPGRQGGDGDAQHQALRKNALLQDADRLQEIRARLGSLSWFMRMINEPLARLANREDDCTGRFWQGRFQSQRLLDEAAVLAAMVYVDLNPVRAGIAQDVGDGEFTSARYRLQRYGPSDAMTSLGANPAPMALAHTSLGDYISLVQWTASAQAGYRRGGLAEHPSLVSRQIQTEEWLRRYMPRPGRWQRAIGSIQLLRQYAGRLGQRWVQTRTANALT